DKLVNILIEQRNQARKDRDFARADDLRDKLDEMGIVLEDTSEKTVWRMR
ncbi:MAG: cysteine--tRNA ligase, partial [Planctomycetota bacterium]|nr:cysteine--tRNA ligase [Planctomycetota bacterium]